MKTAQDNERGTRIAPLLLVLAVLSALFFNGYQQYLLSLSWLALILWGIYEYSLQQSLVVHVDITVLAIASFVLWLLVSLYWHPLAWRGVNYNWRLFSLVYVLLITVYLLRDREQWSTFVTLCSLGVVVAGLSMYQSIVLAEPAEGIFLNKNNNAAFLNLFILPLMSLLLFGDKAGIKKWLISIAFLALLLAELQAVSRGALISLGFVTVLLVAGAFWQRRVRGLLLVSFLVMFALSIDAVISSMELKVHLEAPSRVHLYSSAIDMIRDASWYGEGLGMFFYNYAAYRHDLDISSGHFVHNDYLQFLYELGIPGLTLLLFFAAMLTSRLYLMAKRTGFGTADAIYPGLFAAITAVAIHSMVTFNFYQVAILIVMGFYAGLIIKRSLQLQPENTISLALDVSWKSHIVVTLLLLASIKSIVLPGYADAVASAVFDEQFYDRSSEEKFQIYSKLRFFDPHSQRYPFQAAIALSHTGRGAPPELREKIYLQSRALFAEAHRANPYSIDVYAAESQLIRVYRDIVGAEWHKEAIPLAEKALSMNPRNTRVRTHLAKLFVESGDREQALSVLVDGLSQSNNTNMYYYNYGLSLATELGDSKVAEKFSHLIETYPDDMMR